MNIWPLVLRSGRKSACSSTITSSVRGWRLLRIILNRLLLKWVSFGTAVVSLAQVRSLITTDLVPWSRPFAYLPEFVTLGNQSLHTVEPQQLEHRWLVYHG